MYVICYCFTGDCDVGALLLENGADADAQDVNGRTPMHVAAQCGCTSYLELLITHGTDINIKDKLGVTALHQAERNGYTQCVELLLRHAADSVPTPDYIGESTVPPHVLENISKFESAHPESEDDSDIDLGFGLFWYLFKTTLRESRHVWIEIRIDRIGIKLRKFSALLRYAVEKLKFLMPSNSDFHKL
jgi:FOG: Ankyrin repeat